MTTKEWLNRGRDAMREIETLEKAKSAAASRAALAKSEITEKIAKRTKGRNDETLVKYAEYSAELDRQIAELHYTLAEIARAIYSVRDGTLRLVLLNRYVLFKTWEQIAVDMNFTYRHITRIHGKALQEVNVPE